MEKKDKIILGMILVFILIWGNKEEIKTYLGISVSEVNAEKVEPVENKGEIDNENREGEKRLEKDCSDLSISVSEVNAEKVEPVENKGEIDKENREGEKCLEKDCSDLSISVSEVSAEKVEPVENKGEIDKENREGEKRLEKDCSEDKSDDVSVFGIVIGKTTKSELYRKYTVISAGKWKHEPSYAKLSLEKKMFGWGDLRVSNVKVIVSPEGKVEKVSFNVYGEYFSDLNTALSEKYNTVFFINGRNAKYEKGNVKIILDSDLWKGMVISYESKDLIKKRKKYKQEMKYQKKENMKKIL